MYSRTISYLHSYATTDPLFKVNEVHLPYSIVPTGKVSPLTIAVPASVPSVFM